MESIKVGNLTIHDIHDKIYHDVYHCSKRKDLGFLLRVIFCSINVGLSIVDVAVLEIKVHKNDVKSKNIIFRNAVIETNP